MHNAPCTIDNDFDRGRMGKLQVDELPQNFELWEDGAAGISVQLAPNSIRRRCTLKSQPIVKKPPPEAMNGSTFALNLSSQKMVLSGVFRNSPRTL